MTENLDTVQKKQAALKAAVDDRAIEISNMQKLFRQQFEQIGVTKFPNDLENVSKELDCELTTNTHKHSGEAKNFNQTSTSTKTE